MITLAWYLLKVIICSGILCGYYFLALRNKAFHRWNRFYLLAAIVIALLVPIMKINIFSTGEDKGTVVQVLQTISYGDEAVIEYSHHSGFQLSTENITEGLYLLISAIFMFIFLLSIYKIKRLRKKYPETIIEDVSFINTSEKGTPFSFFKSIFWNEAIDLHSKSGQQIFNHEIAHVKEKHSYDKIFMNIVLIFFWINPFFWLMRKELYMIHEFIADKEALEDIDISSFAEMILQTVYPGQHFSAANGFFYSPIKRRILMLTKNKNPKVNYFSRLLVLPLAAMVFFAFTLKVKNNNGSLYNGKTITVVIDAGHGGKDDGGGNADGIKEKDITLSIAKKIAALNSNQHIKILLSRDNDEMIPVKDRVVFAENNKADLFISIHVNGSTDKQLNGFSVIVGNQHGEQSLALGSSLIAALKETYKIEDKIETRDRAVWILNHNVCPAAIVECGFLSNSTDAAFITKSADQEKVAKNILDAINNYTSSNYSDNATAIDNNETVSGGIKKANDTIPPMSYKNKKVTGLGVSEAKNEVFVKYNDGSKETITKEEAKKRGFVLPPPPPTRKVNSTNHAVLLVSPPGSIQIQADKLFSEDPQAEGRHIDPLKAVLIVNGKTVENEKLANKWITAKKVTIHQGDEQGIVAKYGEKAKNGVIIFEDATIKDTPPPSNNAPDANGKVFTKVENDAQFPGGPAAWQKYIAKPIAASINTFSEKDYGTCVLKFIVDKDGKVSNVEATTMKGTLLARVSINALRNGPTWIPASQNGRKVTAYRLQPVTVDRPNEKPEPSTKKSSSTFALRTIKEDPDKVFTKLEQQASFPGGQSSWLKYISRVIQKNGNELIADKSSEGVCKVRFIVSKEGKVMDVQAVTMQGTKLADVAINAIRKGPGWNPGMQNGHAVNSYVIQPVSFALSDKVGMENEPE